MASRMPAPAATSPAPVSPIRVGVLAPVTGRPTRPPPLLSPPPGTTTGVGDGAAVVDDGCGAMVTGGTTGGVVRVEVGVGVAETGALGLTDALGVTDGRGLTEALGLG